MKRARFSEEQIIGILKAGEVAGNIRGVCREHNVTEQTFYRWRSGKPREPVPAVGLGIVPDHQAASLSCSSHSSKNFEGVSPPSDPWGRSLLYS